MALSLQGTDSLLDSMLGLMSVKNENRSHSGQIYFILTKFHIIMLVASSEDQRGREADV